MSVCPRIWNRIYSCHFLLHQFIGVMWEDAKCTKQILKFKKIISPSEIVKPPAFCPPPVWDVDNLAFLGLNFLLYKMRELNKI